MKCNNEQALSLRPYQSNLIRDIHSSMAEGKKRILAVLPTGAGKTAMFAWMADQTQKNNKSVWFAVHRRELLDQTVETFERFNIPLKRIDVGMISHFANHPDKHSDPDMIVFDEAHHTVARTWKRIIDRHRDCHMIGLTATPARLDGKPLGEIFDDMVIGLTTAELIELGYLSDYKYITSEISLAGLGVVRGDFDQTEAAEKLMTSVVYGNVIETYKKHASGLQAIYFCSTIAHSQEMAQEFRQAGVKAEHFDGNTPKKKRKQIVSQFRSGKIQVLTNVDLIGEGFDMPDCDVVGMLRPTQSLTVYLQQAGRALRPREGKTAVLIDHVGNLNRHGTPTDNREWSLKETVKTQRPRNADGSFQIRMCTECYAVYESSKNECPVCGVEYMPEPDELKVMEQIRMAELDRIQWEREQAELRKPEAVQNARSYSDFCKIAKAKGFKVGWAYVQAKKRGYWVPY